MSKVYAAAATSDEAELGSVSGNSDRIDSKIIMAESSKGSRKKGVEALAAAAGLVTGQIVEGSHKDIKKEGDLYEEQLGCMNVFRRDYGDQSLGWVLYLIFVLLGSYLILQEQYALAAIPYALKILEGFYSPSFAYLLKAQAYETLIERDSEMRLKQPEVRWRIFCTHEEKVERLVRVEGAVPRIEKVSVVVCTHSADEMVHFDKCIDNSTSLDVSTQLANHAITKLESKFVLEGEEYEKKKQEWIEFHSRDKKNTFEEFKWLDGVEQHSVVFAKGGGYYRIFINIWVCTLLMLTGYLGMPYRAFLSSITDKLTHTYRKNLSSITNISSSVDKSPTEGE